MSFDSKNPPEVDEDALYKARQELAKKASVTGEYRICIEKIDEEVKKNEEAQRQRTKISQKLKDSFPPKRK